MRRLDLIRRAPDYRRLFFATLTSGAGTYLAAIALTVDVFDRTDSGKWVSALLIAEFLPMILVGLLLGPLVDRLSRRRLMIASDLVRLAVFGVLPFAGNATTMIGPVVGGLLISARGDPDVAYWVNAATFLVSALFLTRIPARRLQAGSVESRGHWQDIGDGLRVVLGSRALLLVLVVWNVVLLGNAAVNVAEIVLAKVSLDAGDVGFGILVGASGLGLTLGSLAASPLLERFGVRGSYSAAIALMAAGFGLAAVAPHIVVAIVGVIVGTLGNGAAVVCNALLVQRGAPDELRGRAFTVIMSSNYVMLGLGMVAAGPLVDAFGARWLWGGASAAFLIAAATALALARGLGTSMARADLDEALPSRV